MKKKDSDTTSLLRERKACTPGMYPFSDPYASKVARPKRNQRLHVLDSEYKDGTRRKDQLILPYQILPTDHVLCKPHPLFHRTHHLATPQNVSNSLHPPLPWRGACLHDIVVLLGRPNLFVQRRSALAADVHSDGTPVSCGYV